MVKSSSSATNLMYPILQTEDVPADLPSYPIEQFGYGCSAQSNGPSPELGASFLVSYPYMQYTNPNNSRYSPMGTLNFQDRTQIMQSINNVVMDNMAYDVAFQRKMAEDTARYMQDVADVANRNSTMKQLSGEFNSANPMKNDVREREDNVTVTTIPGRKQIVRKGGQDIMIEGPSRTIVRDASDLQEAFEKDARKSSMGIDESFARNAMFAAIFIVVLIFVFASRKD